ncbi:amino-acid N-acetyltransferase [Ectothiorhodospira lacustris]|uniref:amino-acid N-acetyltransferase n=1 Tax=Ectothiorhodospira lacustris TaxID=2899127 RepID=UPI001EE7EC09|nr:amino-acid N-acetyltransferase [Ectothiorhodospira lacustris]MCG5500346.1 amino-acid N-acetyltransferase [Ectothiorhodospira lacustris]MCG5509876.1 amino-acid N-acetyltransferase [Ectothiorhodospira lacustris]MCG5521129.1 amino-acid N-acetyltransferase [Ectothiorhodospira lacustris]
MKHAPIAPHVAWFRDAAPYINTHRDRTFVIAFGGEAALQPGFAALLHDIAILQTLGVRLVLVHGARPQIEARLRAQGAEIRYVNGLRVTDEQALRAVKDAAGSLRVEIEALLSMGLANTPMSGVRVRVSSGNFVTARPLGVRDGVDYLHTGEVRRVDTEGLRRHLQSGEMVLLPPMGYSPTGEIFNLSAEDVAIAAAVALKADKLIFFSDTQDLRDGDQVPITHLTADQAEELLQGPRSIPDELAAHLRSAITACRQAVERVHIVDRCQDGALLMELYTREGAGTLITGERFERLRQAQIEDVGGILELIQPLEAEGILVRRSREQLELEIERFSVIERDGMILACAALYPFPEEQVGELACVAVHADYRGGGRAEMLAEYLESQARTMGITRLFVLTTRTAHWFRERGFEPGELKALPITRQQMYNYQRNSKIFIKPLPEARRKPG